MRSSDQLRPSWGLSLFPGPAILFAVGAFNVLGDGLRDALDPHLCGVD